MQQRNEEHNYEWQWVTFFRHTVAASKCLHCRSPARLRRGRREQPADVGGGCDVLVHGNIEGALCQREIPQVPRAKPSAARFQPPYLCAYFLRPCSHSNSVIPRGVRCVTTPGQLRSTIPQ